MAYAPPTGNFPPTGPTTVTKVVPSYLYKQYDDDEDLQAFVDWTNVEQQEYVDWFANVGLPVYSGLGGELLDWIGAGVYGYPRPTLPNSRLREVGPPNTLYPNFLTPNQRKTIDTGDVYVTTDDIYKRCLTWHLWRGDGRVFTVKWLKRRVMRFLTGDNGGPGATDDTTPVSVSFGIDGQVTIRIVPGVRTITGGAIPNRFAPNSQPPNGLTSTFIPARYFVLAPILKVAIDSGALELPFQFTYVVVVG